MKNGKAPTREQKKIMKAHGLIPENWLVEKEGQDAGLQADSDSQG